MISRDEDEDEGGSGNMEVDNEDCESEGPHISRKKQSADSMIAEYLQRVGDEIHRIAVTRDNGGTEPFDSASFSSDLEKELVEHKMIKPGFEWAAFAQIVDFVDEWTGDIKVCGKVAPPTAMLVLCYKYADRLAAPDFGEVHCHTAEKMHASLSILHRCEQMLKKI